MKASRQSRNIGRGPQGTKSATPGNGHPFDAAVSHSPLPMVLHSLQGVEACKGVQPNVVRGGGLSRRICGAGPGRMLRGTTCNPKKHTNNPHENGAHHPEERPPKRGGRKRSRDQRMLLPHHGHQEAGANVGDPRGGGGIHGCGVWGSTNFQTIAPLGECLPGALLFY